MQTESAPRFKGHVVVRDKLTNEILVDKDNAINFENMSQALAFSLADRPSGHIYQMVFGNGASTVSSVGTISYFSPNVTGTDAQLYNQTYAKIVDDQSNLNTDPANNNIQINHTVGTTYSDIVVTCNLTYNEPADQEVFDTASSTTSNYNFDEIGLKTFDATAGAGFLLCHVIFSPVQKALNRSIEIVYTIRIIMS